MADEKEGTGVAEPITTEPVVVAEQKPPEPEKLPFTLEDVRKLIVEENTRTFKGIQRTVDKKDKEISGLKTQLSNPQIGNVTGLKEILQAVESGDADAIAKAKVVIANVEAEQTRQKQFQYQEKVISENQTKFNEVITKAGLDEDDPRLVTFDLAFEQAKQSGNFEVPEKVLNKILKTVTPKVETKEVVNPISDAEIQKRVDEAIKAERIKLGLLKSDAGAVGGTANNPVFTQEQLRDRAFWEANRDAILKAQQEGRIK